MSKGILYATYIFEVFWLISLENTSIPAKSCLALKPSARESKCILHTNDAIGYHIYKLGLFLILLGLGTRVKGLGL